MLIVKAWMPRYNWGDQINRDLIRLISGQAVELVHANIFQPEIHFLCIGSILSYCDPKSIVWGTGCLSAEDKMVNKPFMVCAVRGPLSRKLLMDQGVECPEIYGDPALLLPRFYHPKPIKKHKSGQVLHWSDAKQARMFKNPILPNLGSFEFIDRILECETIVSSSLHGLIVAEAYGIPADQMALSEEHYQFKFDDYYAARALVDLDKLWDACPFKKGAV